MYWTAGHHYESFYTDSTMSDGDELHDVALEVQYDLYSVCGRGIFVPYATLH